MRPALPVEVDLDTARVRIGPDGERYAEYEMIYTEYDAGRIRAGYACMECGEPQEVPFPERCICGYPMRDEQTKRYGEQFEGYTTVGSAKSIAELRLEDAEAKERARRKHEKPTSQIWLPS